jgi:hypothetical protein
MFVVVGGVVGAAISIAVHPKPPVLPLTASLRPDVAAPPRESPSERIDISAIQRRLLVLEQGQRQIVVPLSDAGIVSSDSIRAQSDSVPAAARLAARQGATVLWRQRINNLVSDFQHETVDSSWAPRMSSSLHTDLERRAARMRFSFSGLECRSGLCYADLHWQEAADARLHGGAIASEFFQSACGKTISFDDEVFPESGPVSGQLFVDCRRFRRDGLDGLSSLPATPTRSNVR